MKEFSLALEYRSTALISCSIVPNEKFCVVHHEINKCPNEILNIILKEAEQDPNANLLFCSWEMLETAFLINWIWTRGDCLSSLSLSSASLSTVTHITFAMACSRAISSFFRRSFSSCWSRALKISFFLHAFFYFISY